MPPVFSALLLGCLDTFAAILIPLSGLLRRNALHMKRQSYEI